MRTIPEYCTVAPRSESIIDPTTPAIVQTIMKIHWGDIRPCSAFSDRSDVIKRIVNQYATPTAAPPPILANKPMSEMAPFVPEIQKNVNIEIFFKNGYLAVLVENSWSVEALRNQLRHRLRTTTYLRPRMRSIPKRRNRTKARDGVRFAWLSTNDVRFRESRSVFRLEPIKRIIQPSHRSRSLVSNSVVHLK